jgi:hypothetical protein
LLPLGGYDVSFDPNRIITYWDAAEEPNLPPPPRKLLRAPFRVALGQTAKITDGWACDPDGDPMQISATKCSACELKGNTWTWSYKPTGIGLEYIDITLSDVRATSDSKTRRGTLVVLTVPANRPPAMGCGARPSDP